MAIEKFNSMKNVEEVVNNKIAPVNTEMNPNMTAAYADSVTSAEHVEEVITELDKKAEEIATEAPEAPAVKEENVYTKLTLDESVNDFNLSFKDLSDESDEDEYLDYDMFDFVYGLVTDDWPRPKNPLGRPMRKFQHTEQDSYVQGKHHTGISQVATDSNGNVVVYANEVEAFDDVKEVCDYYHIKYDEVKPKMNKDSHWNFHLTIYVPTSADNYPVMVQDFFADYGLSMNDVIEDHKVGGGKSANWGTTYDKRVDKDHDETIKYLNDKRVEEIYTKYRNRAGSSNDPLEEFIKDMFAELTEKNLKFSKIALKKRFLAEFEDDFEDEE